MFDLNRFVDTGKHFLFLSGELVLFFVVISFLVGLLMEFLPATRVRSFLEGRFLWVQYVLGAGLGAITPFCSCSTVPLLTGLLRGGVPFGPVMAFLFASPLLNPVIVGLFLMLLGGKITAVYVGITFVGSVLMAALLARLGLESAVKPLAASCACCCAAEGKNAEVGAPGAVSFRTHLRRAGREAWTTFKGVFGYLLLGAGIGAFIYGFCPRDLVVRLAGPGNPWSIPIAAVLGVPMYIRAETILPIGTALIGKGMGVGTVLALVVAGAGASIPEIIILNSIFKHRLVVAFVLTVFFVAIAAGFAVELLNFT